MMNVDQTTELQRLLDLANSGDDVARTRLVGHAYERLRRLAKTMLHQDFPRLRHAHATQSVLHEACARLLTALAAVRPPTPVDFFRFSAAKIRQTLIDLSRQHDRRRREVPDGDVGSTWVPGQRDFRDGFDSANGPMELAMWAEFHEKVAQLPRPDRDVVDLYFYQGLTQAEVARLLGTYQEDVSRRWRRAIQQLPDIPP
jgi:RNA polymerase sigma factor (sigma-70 family)